MITSGKGARLVRIVMLALLVMFSILIAGARAFGRRVSLPPTHLESGDCAQPPCWQGIKPGVSDRWEVERLTYRWLTDHSAFFDSPYMGTVRGVDDYLEVFALFTWGSSLTLADILRDFGTPERISCVCEIPGSKVSGWRGAIALGVELYYFDGQVVVVAILPDGAVHLTPSAAISTVCYYAANAYRTPLATMPWRGLAAVGRYPICHDLCACDCMTGFDNSQ